MFVLPFFRALDWRRPPTITLLLILVNSLVFFLFQRDDEDVQRQAMTYYFESKLPAIEFPLFIEHLKTSKKFVLAQQLKELVDKPQRMSFPLYIYLERDTTFQSLIRTRTLLARDDPQFTVWSEQRAKYHDIEVKSFSHRYGFIPMEPSLTTFFSHMFLHGDFSHLLGNMVFLFILGFVIESLIPKSTFLASYLLAGLAAAGLDMLARPDSFVVGIGASGAISGLMGMYTVIFGLRKIRMFVFVIVYFDFIKAPALLLLPIWLGHELFQLMANPESNVNYVAHIGGIVSGAMLGFVLRRLFPLVDDAYIDEPDKDADYNERLAAALNHIGALRYDLAKPLLLALSKDRPEDINVMLHLFQSYKASPGDAVFHDSVKSLLVHRTHDTALLKRIEKALQDYLKLAQTPQIEATEVQSFFQHLVKAGMKEAAERVVVLIEKLPSVKVSR